ncbi:hypothetical protein PVK62_05065 [Aliivibrio sp. S3MY1]|nr:MULTISPECIES: hypothetical protein [unclassified Aliivibrio]MDD9195207.1 hypothetical protein [Aliivibrio sp. S3MY1]MDD9197772.1 hypothetical protein [Aliivibrio sp. S2MY1]
MSKQGVLGVVIVLIMAAIFTSGLMRAMIELSLFLLLIGYVLIVKRKKKE